MRSSRTPLVVLVTLFVCLPAAGAETSTPRSKTVTAVLREPLPPESLRFSGDGATIVISGPTFKYTVDKTTGTIVALQVEREGRPVIRLAEPASLVIGDDNLAYANCPLWKEHGHPQTVYDCLIELHEMNWRRRQLLHKLCPHAVLVDHCSKALVLPEKPVQPGEIPVR